MAPPFVDPAVTEHYAFTSRLGREQWAWEFLRRNPDYAREWASFSATWRALEALYGSPPNRDFNAWKQDPRAWVHASDCPDGECRVDGDKVLIECALGARWGFHKFPPDPKDDDPVGGGRLTWRERLPRPVPLLAEQDSKWLGDDPSLVALGFDLCLPLREQLEQAKRSLQVIQRRRLRGGDVTLLTVAACREHWTRCLRLLDAESRGGDEAELPAELVADSDLVVLRRDARRLRDGGYLEILDLPEG